jgi:hypothetical protein
MEDKDKKTVTEPYDYRAESDRIHAEYESSELHKKTLELMGIGYTAIHAVKRPTIEELKLRCDR